MGAWLGVITCDKCGKHMKVGQRVLTIAGGSIVEEKEELVNFEDDGIQFACHMDCWDGIVEDVDC